MAKIKLVIAACVILLIALRVWQTTGCRRFASFEFNPLWIKLNVESQVGLDRSTSRIISRFFHNKVSTGLYESAKAYLTPFEPRHTLQMIGPLLLVMIIVGLASVIYKRSIIGFYHLGIILFVNILVILISRPSFTFYLSSLSLSTLSIWSFDFFAKSKLRLLILVGLTLFTFYYFLFTWQVTTICHEIFFN